MIVVTTFKVFVRPHLDCGDILYDQTFITTLAITGAIRGTSREKLYQELGSEPLRIRRWYRKLCLFYQVFKNEHLRYLSI